MMLLLFCVSVATVTTIGDTAEQLLLYVLDVVGATIPPPLAASTGDVKLPLMFLTLTLVPKSDY